MTHPLRTLVNLLTLDVEVRSRLCRYKTFKLRLRYLHTARICKPSIPVLSESVFDETAAGVCMWRKEGNACYRNECRTKSKGEREKEKIAVKERQS